MSDNSLPPNWIEAELKQLIPPDGVFTDGDWVESKDQDPDGDVRLIQLADVGDGKFRDKSARFLTKTKSQELNCTYLNQGDILIARMPDPLGRACIFSLVGDEKYVTVVDVCIMRVAADTISNTFLAYLINSTAIRNQIEEFESGTTRKRISGKNLAQIKIPLPPLPEQRRIVVKIEELFSELDKGIENLKQARAQLAVYRQALLKHAFEGKLTADWRAANEEKLESADQLLARIRTGREARYEKQLAKWQVAVETWESAGKKDSKPSKPRKPADFVPPTDGERSRLPGLPVGWTWLRLGANNVEVFDGPFGSNLKTSDYVGSGVRVVRLENIGVLHFVEERESFISEEKYCGLTEHTVFPGDIVFSSFVTEQTRVALVPKSIAKAVNKSDCFCLRCHGTTLVNRYLCFFLSTRFAYKQLEEVIHGVGRPRINTTQLKELFMPICSPAEQTVLMERIDAQFSALDEIDESLETELQKSEALRQAILKKAFAGELVPQDPADEPAAALLARIRAGRAAQAAASPKRRAARL